jgi:uncharacterized membrane protein YhaH (DUF805 family)
MDRFKYCRRSACFHSVSSYRSNLRIISISVGSTLRCIPLVMSPVMALNVSRWRNRESESSNAVVILVSCIAVMVVTTLRGVHLIYSHDTGLIGVTEPIKT